MQIILQILALQIAKVCRHVRLTIVFLPFEVFQRLLDLALTALLLQRTDQLLPRLKIFPNAFM